MTRNLVSKLGLGQAFRAGMLGSLVLAVVPTAIGCLDRPVAPASPRTSNTLTDQVRVSAVDKIDVVFMIDNSASMADKQKILATAVPDLINRLITPDCVQTDSTGAVTMRAKPNTDGTCASGFAPEFNPITDIHIGVVTSSLGGHGADICADVDPATPGQTNQNNFTRNDRGHLVTRGTRTDAGTVTFPPATTYNGEGFLAWDPTGKKNTPAGEGDPTNLVKNFRDIVLGTDQIGCGYESQLEGWYRFLVDPTPPKTVTAPAGLDSATTLEALYGAGPAVVDGIDDVLLQQRADFLRPDSLVSVIMLTDENDCSIIDGALPGDVCDDPELDANGKPTGNCLTARKGWPANYGIEGNMQGFTKDADGRVSGSTFQTNYLVAQQKLKGSTFQMRSGTAACDSDPNSPDCQSCFANTQGAGCKALDATADTAQLRCWNPRKRFGVDPFYPLGRYVEGLTQTKVYDRDGNHVTNPLFDDLAYNAATVAKKPLSRPKAAPRDAKLVFFAGIVGVPWQDIARDPTDLTKGYLPGVPTETDTKSIDWDYIAGTDPDKRDPLMRETNQVRSGKNVLGEDVTETSWNSINGHEWEAGATDLQYACVFDLPTSNDCSKGATSCDCGDSAQMQKNPLCETPSVSNPKQGDGKSTTTQYRAKGYPGLRYMPVLQQVKANGILASICTPNVTNDKADDFGYRPAVNAIIDRLKTQLTGRCLPRQLAPNPDGSTPCIIIDARFLKDKTHPPDANTQSEINACKKCATTARKTLAADVVKSLTGDVLNYDCLCEVTQVTGQDLVECTTEKTLPVFNKNPADGGWCYVDPSAISSTTPNAATLKEKASAIVEKCGANEKRTIRFVNADTQNTTLFITCLGAASGTSSDTPAATGAAGTTGAAGSAGAAGGK
jgi:hypothetical protein